MEEKDAFYINNAGLVILAPYLPRYFTLLEMMADNQFMEDSDKIRAVQLLQYLATGQTSTPEHLLVFNKVLCGLPLETAIPPEIEITQQEEEVSTSMLNGVIQNWENISGTTIEGLRDSFIIRNGKLTEEEDHWDLTVERKSLDVLISVIPWTISLISQPWIPKRIHTDW